MSLESSGLTVRVLVLAAENSMHGVQQQRVPCCWSCILLFVQLSCSCWIIAQMMLRCVCVQYQILMEFIESLERLTLADKFRRYHPGMPRKQHYKEWSVFVVFFIQWPCNGIPASCFYLSGIIFTHWCLQNRAATCCDGKGHATWPVIVGGQGGPTRNIGLKYNNNVAVAYSDISSYFRLYVMT